MIEPTHSGANEPKADNSSSLMSRSSSRLSLNLNDDEEEEGRMGGEAKEGSMWRWVCCRDNMHGSGKWAMRRRSHYLRRRRHSRIML